MRKSAAMLLALVFLSASCVGIPKPALSSSEVTENSWVLKMPMQVARSSLGVAVVNGKIYAIGGFVENGVVTGANEEYYPETDTWTFRKSMPTARANFAIAVYQNKIYCIGGGVNEAYDTATDTWEIKTSMPTARSHLQANVLNGKIYLIGGYIPDNSAFGYAISKLNEVYDPATDSWTTKAPMPTATSQYPSAVVDDKIYITGGLSSAPESNLNQIYDPATDTWSQGALMPLGLRYGAAGATTGVNAPKRIYSISEFVEWSGTQVYDPLNDSWAFGKRMPTSRENFAVAVVNDLLYAIGGFTSTYTSIFSDPIFTLYTTNEQYTPFGYGTIPPIIDVSSPESRSYTSSEVQLNFTVNRHVEWRGYSLDRQDNVTITDNVTLSGLTNGFHNITAYARDEFENTGASETIRFSVDIPESFPTLVVTAVTLASVSVVGVGLLVYFKKRKR